MEYQEFEIKRGMKLHLINTNKFKTNLIAVFLTTKLDRETVTKNSVLSAVLRRGSMTMPTQEEISMQMEEMYGASFDCGLDKTGDNQVLKFYLETINDQFLPEQGENLLKLSFEKLFDIVFNPYLEKGHFKEEYVEQEKNNIKQRIEGKIDDKARYALERCIEEMYKDKPFGLYKFGYIEDLPNMNAKDLYKYYHELIKNCKIDIFVSGIVDEETKNMIEENNNIKNLVERNPICAKSDSIHNKEDIKEEIKTESMDVNQGKLVLGLDVCTKKEEEKYVCSVYNAILGGTANSKIFQNVREKAHLAYVASSSYLRYKNNIFVNCGIEIQNYEQALNLVKQQIEDMKQGNFTKDDLENAKQAMIASVKTINDEQDTQIAYSFGQEISENKASVEQYIKEIQKVTKEKVIDVANQVIINTIYFLKD